MRLPRRTPGLLKTTGTSKGEQFVTKLLTAGVLVAIAIIGTTVPVKASQEWKLSVGLQNPVFARAEHATEYTPQLVWTASLPNFGVKRLTLFTAGQYSSRNDFPWAVEDKGSVGASYAISRNLDIYSFWESRFRLGESRVVAGVRLNLGGRF